MTDLTLYELEGCPYCTKVKTKLSELGLEYESVLVPRSHGERTEVEEISGQTGVPVLVDEANGIEGMSESDDIVEYLDETYGDAS
ncbi:glutaredoxin [Halorubrum persicum]|uniref:Glutaredoxin n=1 Tax=Halorubrum persicum TaxID=1383844 RepID=A0A2G1WLI0_9EURY|nr:glutathione S-transferase N-terminal domain-containing protein [Halorubrum persicum]PHQ39699.1 glutaredoxin [Halorubrum persicum]